jgi:RNA polymerase sigma-70 factor (ECF subfamily)
MVVSWTVEGNEAELIAQCLKNDALAQKHMYEWLAPRMHALCLRYIADREAARDVLHDGFITLFSKLDTYKGEGSFEGWARRIFITASLMYLRKNDILKHADQLEEAGERVPYDSGIVEQMDARTLMDLVQEMPAGFRTVCNMYAVEGYSHQEIAMELGITEGGSRSQLSRAKIWLKEKLKEYNIDG